MGKSKRKASPQKKEGKLKPEPKDEKAKVPESTEAKGKGGRAKKPVEEEVEVVKWWENRTQHPDGQQWLTLEHNGVMFPPPYKPHGLPVLYRGEDGRTVEIPMDPEEEEVGTMFAVMREQTRPPSDYYVNPVFRRNFFADWLEILNRDPKRNLERFGTRTHPIRVLDRVNFDAIWEWHSREKEKKKSMTPEQKLVLKREREEAEKPFRYCLWDGKKQPVGNFRVEPPGLFRGRGKHPLMGKLKRRVCPEDIIINIGKEAKVPEPPFGKWKEVRHDNKVTWLASWIDNVNGNGKYVMLAASSMVKGQSDYRKFEKARDLGRIVDSIRRKYREDWKSSDEAIRQRAVALYFIDFLALRCGHEKGDDEAETFGACSLKCEHINLQKPDHILFDFLGKDSIRYYNEVKVDPTVYRLCCEFVRGKTPNSDLFDKVKPTALNQHLKELMPGLSAKVFRTFNASQTLDQEFHTNPVRETMSVPEKVAYFSAANTKVALLCNHQRSQPKGFAKSMAGIQDRLDNLNRLVERLKDAKDTMIASKGSSSNTAWEKLRQKWDSEEDSLQRAWLEKYGTEEERRDYQPRQSIKGKTHHKSPSKKKKRKEAKKARVIAAQRPKSSSHSGGSKHKGKHSHGKGTAKKSKESKGKAKAKDKAKAKAKLKGSSRGSKKTDTAAKKKKKNKKASKDSDDNQSTTSSSSSVSSTQNNNNKKRRPLRSSDSE
eukprot:RCo021746